MPKPTSVQLFATCLVETLKPEAGLAVVSVLEKLGLTVEYPEGQTCCGQLAFNPGVWDEARAMGRYTLDLLNKSQAPIVVPSGSCTDMLVHHYPELFASDPVYGPLAQAIAARTYEFTQFLTNVMGVSAVPAQVPQGTKVTYHPSCHLLRGLKVGDGPRQLLTAVEGVDVAPLTGAEECCGFGGLFAVKMSDISTAMLNRKLDHIEETGAQSVVGCDVSCLLHIGGGLHRRGSPVTTQHLAEVLASEAGAK